MVNDLSRSSNETVSEWHDAARSIRIARVARKKADPIALVHGCVVVAEGHVSEARIAAAYAKCGNAFMREITGDFAFALYDVARDRLVVGCDVVGGRTASYFWNGESLVVATRMLALLRHPAVPKKFDRVYRAHALSDFWAQAAGTTAFESIRRLRPGHAIVLENAKLDVRRIDRLALDETDAQPLRGERACDAFRDLLDVVVRERVDENACVALSGGLDSTTVASSISRNFGSINAISIVDSKRPDSDEHEAIAAFAKSTLVHLHEIDSADDVPFTTAEDESPIADDPAVLSWALSETKRRLAAHAKAIGATAIVDGEGGDEIFDVCVRGGEIDFKREPRALLSYLGHAKNPARVLLDEILAPRFETLSDFLSTHRKNDWFAPWMRASFRNDPATCIATKERKKWLFLPRFAIAYPRTIEIAAAQGSNAAARLACDAVGIDSVSPLVDRRIVEFFSRLPASEKFDGESSKRFLRRASSSPEIAARPKDTRLYDAIALRAFANASRREQLVERVMSSPGIGDDVDARELRRGFATIADHPSHTPLVELAAAVIQYAIWSQRVSREYGVT
jgi:asparagine synthase (glutamine-hydrolysing)